MLRVQLTWDQTCLSTLKPYSDTEFVVRVGKLHMTAMLLKPKLEKVDF